MGPCELEGQRGSYIVYYTLFIVFGTFCNLYRFLLTFFIFISIQFLGDGRGGVTGNYESKYPCLILTLNSMLQKQCAINWIIYVYDLVFPITTFIHKWVESEYLVVCDEKSGFVPLRYLFSSTCIYCSLSIFMCYNQKGALFFLAIFS